MVGRPRIFVTRGLVGGGLDRLAAEANIQVWPEIDPPPYKVLASEAGRSQGLLTTISDRIDAGLLQGAPSLRIVSQLAVGYDNVDVAAATRRGVLVCNTPGVLTDATADLAFALMLSFARRLPEGDRALREGRWGPWSPVFMLGHDLRDKTLGIIGLGAIGEAIARRAAGFKMRTVYWSRTRKPALESEIGVAWRDFHDLLREADYVQVSVALNEETNRLIDAAALSLMKSDAVLINTARGPVVDQAALLQALQERRIGGAALDVFEREPLPPDDPLLELENVVVSPHLGSATVETRTRMTDLAVDNLLAFFRGEKPRAPVNEPNLQ